MCIVFFDYDYVYMDVCTSRLSCLEETVIIVYYAIIMLFFYVVLSVVIYIYTRTHVTTNKTLNC